MPLLDLKTQFTSLKFGNDQPKNGSSGLPYIKTSIPPTPYLLDAKGPGFPLYTPETTGNLDYPIRGGSIDFQIGQQTITLSNKIDRARIQSFFKDPKRGPIFIQKQIGLQLTNPKIETANVVSGIGQEFSLPSVLENTRVYNNGVNTLAQVEVMGTGGHAVRHGLYPFAPFQENYFSTVNKQNVNNQILSNRLWNLTNLKMTTGESNFVTLNNVIDINLVPKLGISLNRNMIFQYLGGPGSAYGIGATSIPRFVDTTKLGVSVKKSASSNAMIYDQLRSQKVNTIIGDTATKNIQDFTTELLKSRNNPIDARILQLEARLKRAEENGRDRRAEKIQQRIDILKSSQLNGSNRPVPWTRNQTVEARFYVPNKKRVDTLNSSLPFIFNNADAPNAGVDKYPDMIKFVFEAISNDNTDYSIAIPFRAFLLNGITDNNSAQLNTFKYVGRGENFYTYQGFDRTISFSFRMAAGSKEELKPMFNRLNTLISQVYPDYSAGTNIMRAPLVRITVGDYINRVPGFLENVNVTVDNGSPWEINLDGDSAQLPQVVDVSVSFKPVMDILPQRSKIKFSDNTVTNTSVGENSITTQTERIEKVYQSSPELIANGAGVIQPIIDSKYSTSKITQTTTQDFDIPEISEDEIGDTTSYDNIKYKQDYFSE